MLEGVHTGLLLVYGEARASLFGGGLCSPEGPSTQYLRLLVPATILLMVFGTRDLQYWGLGSAGYVLAGFLRGLVASFQSLFEPLLLFRAYIGEN